MADLGTTTSATDVSGNGNGPPSRSVRRRRSLPGGRAVAGAFLVTAAAVGVFAAYLDATAEPSTSWLVATEDIAPGEALDAGSLDTVAIDLPAEQQEQLVGADELEQVTDRVALGPVRAGDLLQWTTVLAAEPPDGATTFTFSLPGNRVALRLEAGDTIDIVATYSETTVYVARDIQLLSNPSTAAGDGGATITIAVQDPDTVLAIANALDSAEVFVVRSDPDGGDDTPGPYRPDVGRG